MFRKRLQIHWDQRRHRIPEVVGEELADLQKSGRLDIAAGQIASVDGSEDRIAVRIHSYAGGQELFVDRIINCTGASCDLKGAKLPLLESVVEAGLAEYDPLGIGLMVDDDGQTGPQTNVWALGPMCRGCRLETTAVPEIRVQAKRVAEAIVARARAPVMT